jgi:hypothetical protein
MTLPACPSPNKKAKTAPLASKPSLALPKTAGKPLLGTSTSASGSKSKVGVQLKPAGSAAGKARGGGISLAKKECSVLVGKPAAKVQLAKKVAEQPAKEAVKKTAGAKKEKGKVQEKGEDDEEEDQPEEEQVSFGMCDGLQEADIVGDG